jgi:hypothetical protein
MNTAEKLLNEAKRATLSKADAEAQRRGFAYGNAKTENDRVTREMVDRAADRHPRG